ncbi:MAG: hypothetical protein QXR56_05780 [Thermofilaceae archaeon]
MWAKRRIGPSSLPSAKPATATVHSPVQRHLRRLNAKNPWGLGPRDPRTLKPTGPVPGTLPVLGAVPGGFRAQTEAA